jgi:Fe-S-cluster containining protein
LAKGIKKSGKNFPDTSVCVTCYQGSCCREGVEADLFEVARILERSLDIPKPWFKYVGRDKEFPSGYKFETILRNKRCIFQNDAMRCMVYEIRPRFCEEFPLESGEKAPYYHVLCPHGKKNKK